MSNPAAGSTSPIVIRSLAEVSLTEITATGSVTRRISLRAVLPVAVVYLRQGASSPTLGVLTFHGRHTASDTRATRYLELAREAQRKYFENSACAMKWHGSMKWHGTVPFGAELVSSLDFGKRELLSVQVCKLAYSIL